MSYTALYRKYRPKVFEEVFGQEHITKTLKNEIISGRIGHAYLFNGGRGTGKTSTAKIFSRAINCLNPQNGNPCNECEICKAALNGSLTDIVEMDAASNNSVEDIRQIRDEVNFLPTVTKYRVYIIDEVHMLSIGAFNALLKTLEEPPEHVKFVLATTEPQKIPATILSRCQRFDFKKISNTNIEKRLDYICKQDNIKIEKDALVTISSLADGAMRDGISILERCIQENADLITNDLVKDLVGIPKTEIVNKILNDIIDYNVDKSIEDINLILEDGKDIVNLLWEIIKYTKDVLIYKTTQKLDIYSKNELEQIDEISKKVDKNRLLDIIFSLSELSNEIKNSTQKTILFQVGIMKLCVNNVNLNEINLQNNNSINLNLVQKSAENLDNKNVNYDKNNINLKNSVNNINQNNSNDSGLEKNNEKIQNNNLNFENNIENSGKANEINNINANEIKNMNNKIVNLQQNLQKTINAIKKLAEDQQVIHNSVKNVDTSVEKSQNSAIKSYKSNVNLQNLMTNKKDGKKVEGWIDLIKGLKEEGRVTLYSSLAKSEAIELNDMTIGIYFPEGLTPFEIDVVGKSENIMALNKAISVKYGKTMQIRIINNSDNKNDNEIDNIMKELDLPLNVIEE